MPYMYPTTPYKTVPLQQDSIPSLGEPKQQVLWIGCSDSGSEEITTLDLLPDETIVLRNIGNIFLRDGLTCLSMVQYAVDILQVSKAFQTRFLNHRALIWGLRLSGEARRCLRALWLRSREDILDRWSGRAMAKQADRPTFGMRKRT